MRLVIMVKIDQSAAKAGYDEWFHSWSIELNKVAAMLLLGAVSLVEELLHKIRG